MGIKILKRKKKENWGNSQNLPQKTRTDNSHKKVRTAQHRCIPMKTLFTRPTLARTPNHFVGWFLHIIDIEFVDYLSGSPSPNVAFTGLNRKCYI
jgi:hypothetical protein